MRCPFCQNPTQEEAAECASCGFSLPKLDQFLGIPPAVHHGISDARNALSGRERRRVVTAQARFSQKFPQVGFTVFLEGIKPDTPLALYSFWIFNRSTLCAGLKKGSANRETLLTIDTDNRRASLIIGYGLEPFIGAQHLDEILAKAQVELTQHSWGLAILTVIDCLTDRLASVHAALRRTYGAQESELGIAAGREVPAGEPAY